MDSGRDGGEILAKGYQAKVWRKGGAWYVHLPQLSLLVHASDMQAAWQKAEESASALYQEHVDAGLADSFPDPRGSQGQPGIAFFSSGSAIFLAKTLVMGLAVVLALSFGANVAMKNINRNFNEMKTGKITARIHNFAEDIRSASPEARQAVREDLQLIMGEARLILADGLPPAVAPRKP